MRSVLAVIIAGIVATLGAACSSGQPTTDPHVDRAPATVRATDPTVAARRAADSPQTTRSPQATPDRTTSAFCATARKIGLRHLNGTGSSTGAGPVAMLPDVDRLAALAPAQIRSDFRMFDRFEHAVLGSGNGRPTDLDKLNSPGLAGAMQRVGAYLTGTCEMTR